MAEIEGMAIAECLGGTYARCASSYYTLEKPGRFTTHGSFFDAAVTGCAAGWMSKIYGECL